MCEPSNMELAAYRKNAGLSQEELAREIGLKSKSYISEIEGRTRVPSLRVALKIEKWSRGAVSAADLNPEAAELIPARRRRARAA